SRRRSGALPADRTPDGEAIRRSRRRRADRHPHPSSGPRSRRLGLSRRASLLSQRTAGGRPAAAAGGVCAGTRRRPASRSGGPAAMRQLRYPPRVLYADYLRSAAGLAVGLGVLLTVPPGPVVVAVFGALAVLFGAF